MALSVIGEKMIQGDELEDRKDVIDRMYAQLLLEQPNNQFLWDRIEERSGKKRPRDREPGEEG